MKWRQRKMAPALKIIKFKRRKPNRQSTPMACKVYYNKSMFTKLHKHLYKVPNKHRWRTYENTAGSFSKNMYFSPWILSNKTQGL